VIGKILGEAALVFSKEQAKGRVHMNFKALLFGAALAAPCVSGAHAATTTVTWDVTASGFGLVFSPGNNAGAAPFDPVTEEFSVTFDPTVAVDPTSVGLDIISLSLPFSSASQFSWDPSSGGDLVVATEAFVDGFGTDPNTYGVLLSEPLASSSSAGFLYSDSSGNIWEASDVTAVAVAATPLPDALPLFAAGLGMLGFFGTKKRPKKRIA
jgi:hypothetical protein